jgi:hypothetical protein
VLKKLSEFILELEDFKKVYGDLVVACSDNDIGCYTPYLHLTVNEYWDGIPDGDKFCDIDWVEEHATI